MYLIIHTTFAPILDHIGKIHIALDMAGLDYGGLGRLELSLRMGMGMAGME